MNTFAIKPLSLIAFIFTISFVMSGCSGITSGTTQKVSFTTSLEGKDFPNVQCTLNDGGKKMTFVTPTDVVLSKKSQDVVILCQKVGYKMLHAELLKHDSHLTASAGKGALSGAGITAIAAAPLLVVPILGAPLYGISIGLGTIVGGATSASTDAVTGGGYTLPDHIDVPMIKSNDNDEAQKLFLTPVQ